MGGSRGRMASRWNSWSCWIAVVPGEGTWQGRTIWLICWPKVHKNKATEAPNVVTNKSRDAAVEPILDPGANPGSWSWLTASLQMDGRRQGERGRLGGIKRLLRLSRDSSTTYTLPSMHLVSNKSDSKLNILHINQALHPSTPYSSMEPTSWAKRAGNSALMGRAIMVPVQRNETISKT